MRDQSVETSARLECAFWLLGQRLSRVPSVLGHGGRRDLIRPPHRPPTEDCVRLLEQWRQCLRCTEGKGSTPAPTAPRRSSSVGRTAATGWASRRAPGRAIRNSRASTKLLPARGGRGIQAAGPLPALNFIWVWTEEVVFFAVGAFWDVTMVAWRVVSKMLRRAAG